MTSSARQPLLTLVHNTATARSSKVLVVNAECSGSDRLHMQPIRSQRSKLVDLGEAMSSQKLVGTLVRNACKMAGDLATAS